MFILNKQRNKIMILLSIFIYLKKTLIDNTTYIAHFLLTIFYTILFILYKY